MRSLSRQHGIGNWKTILNDDDFKPVVKGGKYLDPEAAKAAADAVANQGR